MEEIIQSLNSISTSLDGVWILVGIALVFFMQAGFAMVETGFTRAKNAGNIIMKNLMDFCLGAIAFWLIGYSIMINHLVNPFTMTYVADGVVENVDMLHFMFFMVFCATTATIVSGAMAERTKFISYCIYSVLISAFIFPTTANWIWNGGFLSQWGFHDFAGSTAVHMMGGVAALIGAIFLGPRIGKYKRLENGKLESKAIPGHSLTLGALGVFILFFGWYGFNGASEYAIVGDSLNHVSSVFVTTTMAAAVASTAVMIITWIKYKKPDVSMTLNGTLAGLVAITAGCDQVSVFGSACIGLIAGFIVVYGIEFLDTKLHIDDPVGAVGVHCFCGAAGTILVGVFGYNGLYGWITGTVSAGEGFKYLGIQIAGVAICAAFAAVTMIVLFFILKKSLGLRVSKEEEIIGLDLTEHGLVSSYADFMPVVTGNSLTGTLETKDTTPFDVTKPLTEEEAIPVKKVQSSVGKDRPKMSKIVILANPAKFESLKTAMDNIGITGMTVTNVTGCGLQKGDSSNYYRGVKVDISLLPKIKMELVVSKIPVDTVIKAAKGALYTGNYGDGKIFVYDVDNVYKIRTGEWDYAALQDE